jgi:NAD(P)-dependent dehydrogenase (short-subunit alcohol dehydrogenase family)
MPSTSPVVLILGAGSNVGKHVARAFASKGYKVALAARSLKEADDTPDQINIPSDLSDPDSVVRTFAKAEEKLGVPSVVVYNGEYSSCLIQQFVNSC